MKNDQIAAAESYVLSLRDKDLSRVPLAEDVVFKGPLSADEICGASALRDFLNGILPIIKDARIHLSFSDGEHVCVLWELETIQPPEVIPICEYFRVVDGKLKEVKPFYDPRPITGPAQ